MPKCPGCSKTHYCGVASSCYLDDAAWSHVCKHCGQLFGDLKSQIPAFRLQGLTIREISSLTGYAFSTIERVLKDNALTYSHIRPKSEDDSMVKRWAKAGFD